MTGSDMEQREQRTYLIFRNRGTGVPAPNWYLRLWKWLLKKVDERNRREAARAGEIRSGWKNLTDAIGGWSFFVAVLIYAQMLKVAVAATIAFFSIRRGRWMG